MPEQRLAHECDALAHDPCIGAPHALSENLDDPACRQHTHARNRQKRRLARTIGTQKHPTFVRFDHEVDAIEYRSTTAHHRYIGETDRRGSEALQAPWEPDLKWREADAQRARRDLLHTAPIGDLR